MRRRVGWALLLVVLALAVVALLAQSPAGTPTTTSPPAAGAPTPTPSPSPTSRSAVLRALDGTTQVVDGSDSLERAAAMSEALVLSSPAVVLVSTQEPDLLARAASIATALGVPLLLTGQDPDGRTAAEITRLGAADAIVVGAADPEPAIAGLRLRHAPEDPSALARLVGFAGSGLPPTVPAAPATDALVLDDGDPSVLGAVATARAVGATVVRVPGGDPRASSATVQAVSAATTESTTVLAVGPAFDPAELAWTVATAATGVELPGGGQLLFPGRRIVALYGNPGTPALGLLGEQDLAGSIERARGLAATYQALTPETVVPGFEIIATIASRDAGADGDYSDEMSAEALLPWVQGAREAGIYVVLDLQPGRTDFLTQAKRYESLLVEPNVGLALDPEWRLAPDQVHLRQIGSVGVDEVNAVSAWLADLTRERALPQKLFVVHQFASRMIDGRERLDLSRSELAVMVHVDGQGSQPAKAGTWAALRRDAPAGLWWGWKNFIDEDSPMLTPEQTLQVDPVPDLVTYQ
ncbi:hypothetical protein [Actinotalea sp.]|uniref:hypothetical protein n=1 Tax=Actinotalea sp. TaxID=1872145 RepID=UPI003569E8FD